MHDHPGSLVDHQDVLVLEDHLKRDLFGEHLASGRRRRVDDDLLAGPGLVAGLLATTVDGDVPLRNEGGGLIARQLELTRDEEVETRRLVGRYDGMPARN